MSRFSYLIGRFSGVHLWPVLGVPRGNRRDGITAPAFVELLTASTATATSCVVEVESRSGGKLRLDLKAIAPSQLAELIRVFAAS